MYGLGTSEEFVGQVAAGRRDEIQLFTKVAPGLGGPASAPGRWGPPAGRAPSGTCTDHLDLYQLHWPDDGVPLEDTGAMALVDEGPVRHDRQAELRPGP